MRPVASNIDAPCKKIAKRLVREFTKLTPIKKKSVKSAIEFMNILKGVKINRTETMGSYDVVSLYPSIPRNETTLPKKLLLENNVHFKNIDMYVEYAELCMDQNVFQYDEKFFIQREAAAIGNSLSGFLAETSLENHPLFPRLYVRFEDDIFVIQKSRKVRDTLNLFNAQQPRVQFTSSS